MEKVLLRGDVMINNAEIFSNFWHINYNNIKFKMILRKTP